MANSKAYLPFVLLFAFLLTSHVLAHHEPQNRDWYDEEGNVIEHHVNPTSYQDSSEIDWSRGSSKPSFRHFVGHGYETPRLEDVEMSTWEDRKPKQPSTTGPDPPRQPVRKIISSHNTDSTTNPSSSEVNEKHTRPYNAEVDELGESDWTFPQAPRKSVFETRSSHPTDHSTTNDPSNLEVNEKSTRPYKAEVDESGEPRRHWTFPQSSRKTMLRAGSSHNITNLTTYYNPSNLNLEVNEPKKTRHRIHGPKKHPKPGFWRAFREFQARTAKDIEPKNRTEPKNYTDYSVTRHGNMERHASPEYYRAFNEFQARTYGRIDGDVPILP